MTDPRDRLRVEISLNVSFPALDVAIEQFSLKSRIPTQPRVSKKSMTTFAYYVQTKVKVCFSKMLRILT